MGVLQCGTIIKQVSWDGISESKEKHITLNSTNNRGKCISKELDVISILYYCPYYSKSGTFNIVNVNICRKSYLALLH